MLFGPQKGEEIKACIQPTLFKHKVFEASKKLGWKTDGIARSSPWFTSPRTAPPCVDVTAANPSSYFGGNVSTQIRA